MKRPSLVAPKAAEKKVLQLLSMTIGKLARAAGVNVETIRYYQRRGLLPKSGKPVSGYRRYAPTTLARLRFIKRAQQLGFTLREIGDLLKLNERACRETRVLAQHKLVDIEIRLRDLGAMRRTLATLLRACDTDPDASCPIIETLSRED